MTTKTVTWVADDLSTWESNGKTTYYINVGFSDDTYGSLGKQNQGKAEELRGLLVALMNQEAEFGLEDKGKKTQKGQTKFTIKSFPGYEPEPYRGDGSGKVAHRNTPEGMAQEQDSIHRSVALTQAIAAWGTNTTGSFNTADVLAVADDFYNWLTQTTRASKPGSGEAGATPTAPATPATNTGSARVPANDPVPASPSSPAEPNGQDGSGEPQGAGATTPPGSCPSCGSTDTTDMHPEGNRKLPLGRSRCLGCGYAWKP